ncbi:hypothetical protein [Sulfitobacter geojensis]|uniref:hypothetical protein n=1 Tax=Sulfitobacter geojensis TaxID=1342299 RepID=UPI00046A2A97|nr:hypothetical protein [Sulfitobacter geojensis]KHA53864.1 hypothetical protein Z947_4184 [Sulfitobacter geojensis]NYI27500.1 hypothetical protein [Sulfitobacter geojensis]
MFTRIISSTLALFLSSTLVFADSPQIENVAARKSGNYWSFDVTLKHGDTGWDHYADAWRVVDMDGNELGLRNLAHPHTNEQPFTRSLSGVEIPAGMTEVGIQARDNISGWGSEIKRVKLR